MRVLRPTLLKECIKQIRSSTGSRSVVESEQAVNRANQVAIASRIIGAADFLSANNR